MQTKRTDRPGRGKHPLLITDRAVWVYAARRALPTRKATR